MITKFKPGFSLEEIAVHVSSLKEDVGVSEMPLARDETVAEWGGVTARRAGSAAARLSSGRRGGDEEDNLREAIDVRTEYMGAVALDLVLWTHRQGSDTDEIKRELVSYVRESNKEMLLVDYSRRLEMSSIERAKRRLAQDDILRRGLSLAVSAATSAALFKTFEVSSPLIDLSPTERGGAIGLLALVLNLTTGSMRRNLPPQIGNAFKNVFNTSIMAYMLKDLGIEDDKDMPLTLDELLEKYAERDSGRWAKEITNVSQMYVLESEADMAPMVGQVLRAAKTSMYECYGITPEDNRKSWRQRTLGRFALAG